MSKKRRRGKSKIMVFSSDRDVIVLDDDRTYVRVELGDGNNFVVRTVDVGGTVFVRLEKTSPVWQGIETKSLGSNEILIR